MEEKTHIKMLTNKTDIMYKTTGMSIRNLFKKKKYLAFLLPRHDQEIKAPRLVKPELS
jgi:hypothetical protein